MFHVEHLSFLFAFCGAIRCLLACLAIDPDGHGAIVRQRYLHVGAEATCADGAPESLLEGANDLVIEGFGDLGAGADEFQFNVVLLDLHCA